jgi:hypothetical protein
MNLNGPITGNSELDSYLFLLKRTIEDLIFLLDQQNKKGYSGSFTTATKTITVEKGIIISVENI